MATASSLVEKATSDLLIGPDWGMNLEICDVVNRDPGQVKDVIKAVKKRIGNKNSKVQFLALTVLETLIKNCGINVHQQVAEKDVLTEMVKVVKKKADMNVRDKILVLLDSWQEAFGGARSRFPQYYAAYEDLRRSGVEFPQRDPDSAAPIFTPPQSHPIIPQHPPIPGPVGFMPPRPDVVIPSDMPSMSLADFEAARSAVNVLNEILNAVDPQDKQALKDDLITDLANQCHSYERRVMQLVSTTSDEELLRRGLALNDDLQKVIAKNHALLSGSPLPQEHKEIPLDQEEEEAEDEFSQLAHRSKSRSQGPSQEARKNGTGLQFAIPPPPQPSRMVNASNTIDLLSGDSFHQEQAHTQPQPPPNPNPNPTPTPTPSENPLSNTNPFATKLDGTDHISPYPQRVQNSPPSSSQDSGGFVNPWAAQFKEPVALSEPADPTTTQSNYNPTSLWNSNSPGIPPPPVLHTQRQSFFHQQINNNNPASEFPGNNVELPMQNLSIQEDPRNRNPYPSLGQSSRPPADRRAKEAGQTDKLFEDLVDLPRMRANFKSTGGAPGTLSRP